MKTYTREELQEILRLHKLWLNDDENGVRADLSRADLYKADLSGADLSRADLSRAYLSGAYLSGADLSRANLYGADLSGADLSGADLSGAYLSWANLSGADLSGADLSWANLSWANLSGAYLHLTKISDDEYLVKTLFINGTRHSVSWYGCNQIQIGCHKKEIPWWKKNYKMIGEKEGYTPEQIAEYYQYILMCEKMQKSANKLQPKP